MQLATCPQASQGQFKKPLLSDLNSLLTRKRRRKREAQKDNTWYLPPQPFSSQKHREVSYFIVNQPIQVQDFSQLMHTHSCSSRPQNTQSYYGTQSANKVQYGSIAPAFIVGHSWSKVYSQCWPGQERKIKEREDGNQRPFDTPMYVQHSYQKPGVNIYTPTLQLYLEFV